MLSRLLRRVGLAFRRPVYTARSLARDLVLADERVIGAWTGHPAGRIRSWTREPLRDEPFREHLAACERRLVAEFGDTPGGKPTAKGIRLQYALVRAARPELVVETGVANGVSSAHFLRAMERNGRGRLISIDLPDEAYLPDGERIGWMVPEGLRDRWEVRTGDARELLPAVLEEAGSVDLFVHDSLHTREHMLFELREAWPAVTPDGHLVCDDADRNAAFEAFCREAGPEDAAVLRGVGFARKRGATR